MTARANGSSSTSKPSIRGVGKHNSGMCEWCEKLAYYRICVAWGASGFAYVTVCRGHTQAGHMYMQDQELNGEPPTSMWDEPLFKQLAF
jgi:hypothetical protein